MSDPLEPNINAYGTYARVEALADWLEMAALCGRRVTRAQFEDIISDNGWTDLSPQQFKLAEGVEEFASAATWVEAVRSTLERRRAVLESRWPFDIVGTWRVVLKPDGDAAGPYVALLALTVAHAWSIEVPHRPEVVLESTIVRALNARGISAAQVGTATEGVGGFVEVVKRAAAYLGLRSAPEAVVRKAHAKDEGVDTIALVGWPEDPRLAGQWVFLGQATVARSNEWYRKLTEPRIAHWKGRLLQPLSPQRFLVVPHHVAADYLTHLVASDSGLVIDRIRLTLSLDSVSEAEREILESVISVGVADGRAAA